MNSIDLKNLVQDINAFVEERDWDQFHSIKNLASALSVESSELLEIVQWLTEEQSNRIAEDPKLMGKLEDEVADVFVYLLRIAHKTNMDLEGVVRRKMQKNAAKYPVEKSKGRVTKYTEL